MLDLSSSEGPGLRPGPSLDADRILKAGEVAYRAARTVELLAFPAEGLATRPLLHVLGGYAVASLAVGVVVVDLGVGRVPRSPTPQGAGGGLPHLVRSPTYDVPGPTNEPFVLVRSHALPPPLACRL